MRAWKSIFIKLLFCVMLFTAISPRYYVSAAEIPVAGDSAIVQETVEVITEGGEAAANFTAKIVWQMITFLPYVGVVLFVVGIFIAIFSTRNKGNRRWGLKMAIMEAVIVFIMYIALILVYDYVCLDRTVQLSSRPEQQDFYEKTYYDTVDRMKVEGQSFLFLGRDWINGVASAGRSTYMSVVALLIYASISIGVLLLLITKMDKSIRRFALAGLCIASPLTLIVGAIFLSL